MHFSTVLLVAAAALVAANPIADIDGTPLIPFLHRLEHFQELKTDF